MLIAGLFIIVLRCKQPGFPSSIVDMKTVFLWIVILSNNTEEKKTMDIYNNMNGSQKTC